MELRLFTKVCLLHGCGKEGGGEESEKFCTDNGFTRTWKLDRSVLLYLWRVGCSFTVLFLTAWLRILGCVLMMP